MNAVTIVLSLLSVSLAVALVIGTAVAVQMLKALTEENEGLSASNYRMSCRLEAVRLAEEEARAKRSAAVAKGNKTRKAMKAARG